MTKEKAQHLRHDTGATIPRRALMVAGFFLGLLTYTGYGATRDLLSGYDPASAHNLPPLEPEAIAILAKAAKLNFSIALAGFLIYTGLLIASFWRVKETAILGLIIWAVGRGSMILIKPHSGSSFWLFLMLDLLILGALIRGFQAVRTPT
jgi:hypothetical protein